MSMIRREVTVQRTARFIQGCGKFDLPTAATSVQTWDVDVTLPAEWSVLVIVGPSMSGKTSIANELFPGELVEQGHWDWPRDKCILDGFPAGQSIDDICGLLSSVGFSSPPDWKKPYAALSNGGKFRVDLARTLAERPKRTVIDEFGSLVHQQARNVAAAAAAKAVRRRGGQLVALVLYPDAVPYFEPDVVIDVRPGEKVTAEVTRGLLRRPAGTIQAPGPSTYRRCAVDGSMAAQCVGLEPRPSRPARRLRRPADLGPHHGATGTGLRAAPWRRRLQQGTGSQGANSVSQSVGVGRPI